MGLFDIFSDDSVTPARAAAEISNEVDVSSVKDETIAKEIDQKAEEHDLRPIDVATKLEEQHPEVEEKILGRLREKVRQWVRDPNAFESREEVRTAIDELEESGAVSADTADDAKREAAAGNIERSREIVFDDPQILEQLGVEELGNEDVGLFAETEDNQNMTTDQKQEEEGMGPVETAEELGAPMDTLEDYAEEMGTDVEHCARKWLDENTDMSTDDVEEMGDYEDEEEEEDDKMNVDEKLYEKLDDFLTEDELDEKFEEFEDTLTDAVTSEEVVKKVAEKMAQDDEAADRLVETVEEKGDFEGSTPSPDQTPSDEGMTLAEVMEAE